jgi:metal-responsive CopG/Arc/MetJ family transcriptional regulator
MKFAGTLSVICPTDRIEKIHGDRLLNSFTQVFDEKTGSTRTKLTEDSIREYQQSVREGKEIDSDGRNMLVYDFNRDNTSNTINKEALDQAHKLILSTLG